MTGSQITYTPAGKRRSALGQTSLQALALLLIIPIWLLWIQSEYGGSLIGPAQALIITSYVGVLAIGKVAKSVGAPKLASMGWVYMLKITLVLFFVIQYWMPHVNQTISYGYDPQRYYVESIQLLHNGFETAVGQSLRNVGILFYYAFQMQLFGENPFGPALMNSFVSLVAGLLITVVYWHVTGSSKYLPLLLAFLMVIPETAWFDSITGREAMVTASLVFIILGLSSFLLGFMERGMSRWWLLVVPYGFITLGLVRPVMLLAAITSIALISVMIRFSVTRSLKSLLVIIALSAFAIGIPVFSEFVGSSTFAYDTYLGSIGSGAAITAQQWDDTSVGLLFVANNIFESLLFIPARVIAHLLAPLPNVNIAWSSPLYIQHLVAVLSAIVYVGMMPRVASTMFYAVRYASYRQGLLFHIPLLVTLVAVSWGQPYIHERYRIMAVPFFMAVALLPAPSRRVTALFGFVWFAFLLLGGLLYVVYKLR